jgi:hypothetical protein
MDMSQQPTKQSQKDTDENPNRNQVGKVPPSGLNRGDHGVADNPLTSSEQLNFDDASEDHPRGDTRRTGGTWDTPAHNTGDQGDVGVAPGAGLSDRIGPSDPDPRP